MSKFNEKDIEELDAFGKLIAERGEFRLTTKEAVQLVRGLQFINSLRKKIADNVLEYRRIIQEENSEAK